MSIEVYGYSERGMMNALFYDMASDDGSMERLKEFLTWLRFPLCSEQNQTPNRYFAKSPIQNAKVLVEQSFSDFGDLDALILLDYADGRCQSILIEAKVKTAQRALWSIQDEWLVFRELLLAKASDSNLFVQLYRKLRLTFHLQHPDSPLQAADVPSAWRLGTNAVVWKAAEMLKPYVRDAWYLCVVPDSTSNTEAFFQHAFADFIPEQEGHTLPQWDVKQWGFLTWKDINSGIADGAWPNTKRSLGFNNEQIYGQVGAAGQEPQSGDWTDAQLHNFLEQRTGRQIALLRALAGGNGRRTQAQLLAMLGIESRQLGTLKGSINLATDVLHRPRLLGATAGSGGNAIHSFAPAELLRQMLLAAIASFPPEPPAA